MKNPQQQWMGNLQGWLKYAESTSKGCICWEWHCEDVDRTHGSLNLEHGTLVLVCHHWECRLYCLRRDNATFNRQFQWIAEHWGLATPRFRQFAICTACGHFVWRVKTRSLDQTVACPALLTWIWPSMFTRPMHVELHQHTLHAHEKIIYAQSQHFYLFGLH